MTKLSEIELTETQNLALFAGSWVAGCSLAAIWYRFLPKYRFRLAVALLG